MRKEIDLTDPHLGSELLEDPKGDFPLDVWEAYCVKASDLYSLDPSDLLDFLPVLSWRKDPAASQDAAIDPQKAVDEAVAWAAKTVMFLEHRRPQTQLQQLAAAVECANRTFEILARAESSAQRGHGQPASMRPIAVRAWVIHKFNPQLRWREVADRLFRENGKCPRCGLTTKHQHSSPCVKALEEAVRKLTSAMKDDGIPVK
jgi:hypothetical protein